MIQSLYDTINKEILNTNGLNIFTIILDNILKILLLKTNKLRIWWTQQKQKFNL